jgi:hypothetical protein
MPDRNGELMRLADKQSIEDLLARHNRSIDRRKRDDIAATYHPDGTSTFGQFFDGPGRDFAAALTGGGGYRLPGLHKTSNTWIALDGERARSESYVAAVSAHEDSGTFHQAMIGGRYLDALEKRDGVWKLLNRTYVLEWNFNYSNSAGRSASDLGYPTFTPRGAQAPEDISETLFAMSSIAMEEEQAVAANGLSEELIDSVLVRQELRELGLGYCRGVDRADEALLSGLFHPDAIVITGLVNDNGRSFPATMARYVREKLKRPFHSVSNDWYEIAGDRAHGESYVLAAFSRSVDGQERDSLVGGRFIDRFERRDGAWRFSQRTFVLDWSLDSPPTGVYDGGMYQQLTLRGGFKPDDPIYLR